MTDNKKEKRKRNPGYIYPNTNRGTDDRVERDEGTERKPALDHDNETENAMFSITD